MKNRVGIHLRLQENVSDALCRGKKLDIKLFQMFLVTQKKEYVKMTDQDIKNFKKEMSNFEHVIIHSSYWTQLTNSSSRGFTTLLKEVQTAEKLGCSAVVIHPGSFVNDISLSERVEKVARSLEQLLAETNSITLLLENSSHQGRSFTGSIEEYGMLFEKFKQCNRVKMCFDTAHAFAFGHDIRLKDDQEVLIQKLDDCIGLDRVGLIHCNDILHKLGSYRDHHAVPGQGNIGFDALYAFITHVKIQHIPVILEMPELSIEFEKEVVNKFLL